MSQPEGFQEVPMPPITHHFAGGVYAKQIDMHDQMYVETHKHKFDHMSILATGKVRVTVDGVAREYVAPEVVYIKADQVHEILTLSDNVTWFCIHAVPDDYEGSGEYIDDVLVKHE